MASQSKTKTVKFEVGHYVLFSGHRVGRVSRIAKNGAVYVSVLGETTVEDQTQEELRVKKADLRHVCDMMAATGDCTSEWDYVANMIRANISRKVTAQAKLADNWAYELAPDYIPSPGCLEYCEWEGSEADKSVMHNFGIDLVKLANLYTGKSNVEVGEVEGWEPIQSIENATQEPDAPQGWDKIEAGHEAEEIVAQQAWEPIQSTFAFPTEPKMALAEATYALRELTFSVTRHSILTAFIDVALNKDIPGYHYQVASNIKNLMAAAFDPVHDSVGYARIKTWMMAALELVVKNKDRVAKMLNQPIEAAPIKIDRVTKLGMWLDNMMAREVTVVNDRTSAYDSGYTYDALGKKLEAYTFVVVEVIPSGYQGEVSVIPLPAFGKESTPFQEYLTAQSAIAYRKQCIDCYRPAEPNLHRYCGIVPIHKTGLSMQAAINDTLASAIDSLKGIK